MSIRVSRQESLPDIPRSLRTLFMTTLRIPG